MAERNLVGWIEEELAAMPRRSFRERLRNELEGRTREMTAEMIQENKGRRPGFATVTPYLQMPRGAEVVAFIEKAFDGVVTFRMDHPNGELGHAEVRIGDSMLAAGDSGTQFPSKPTCLHLYVPDVDATYQRALDAGAVSIYAPMDQPYGDREAGVIDAGGNSWFIATHQGGGDHKREGFRSLTAFLTLEQVPGVIDYIVRATGAAVLERHEAPPGTVRHATVRVGDSLIEMGEAQAAFPAKPAALYLYVDDADAWFQRALDAGASVLYPVEDKPYGDRMGGVTDPFGNIWYLSTHLGDRGRPNS